MIMETDSLIMKNALDEIWEVSWEINMEVKKFNQLKEVWWYRIGACLQREESAYWLFC